MGEPKEDNPMFLWSKENTKQVRIHTKVWEVLKDQSEEEGKSMMQLLNKLIVESYGNE